VSRSALICFASSIEATRSRLSSGLAATRRLSSSVAAPSWLLGVCAAAQPVHRRCPSARAIQRRYQGFVITGSLRSRAVAEAARSVKVPHLRAPLPQPNSCLGLDKLAPLPACAPVPQRGSIAVRSDAFEALRRPIIAPAVASATPDFSIIVDVHLACSRLVGYLEAGTPIPGT
jgi:hypothetical protein